MSCFVKASAIVRSGTTGFILVVTVEVFSGVRPAVIEKGSPPFDPEDVFPVFVTGTVPSSPSRQILEVAQNLENEDQFGSVVIFCEGEKQGAVIAVIKVLA